MKISKYNPIMHNKDIKIALTKRLLFATNIDELPQLGLVYYVGSRFVAAGFIRAVESSFCLLDSYITDPDIDPESRNTILDKLTRALFKLAKDNKYTQLIAFSNDKNTLERAYRHGFVKLSHTVISIDLTSEQGA